MRGALRFALWAYAWQGGASALSWQDCGLLADERGLELLEYHHEPDPIVLGQPYSITRRFRSLLDRPIRNLTEKFQAYNRSGEAWSPTFAAGPFSRCGDQQFQTKCPLEPKAEFSFHERHPTTHAQLGEHRAVEHYFADGAFVGCAVVVYRYVPGIVLA
ncbi:unnamed protein product [Symbiodinium natans]|uniref:Phosphatidylglycerol/phosphatidylinositol transfer protein n=1 Tax=Symbiodinium natans TaxID=878477 RepID=A0A812IA21_9DINO|nr:unnamed protein product [Symbiodinium natans]